MALFINPFYTQLQHNRRRPEISELSFLFNCFRPLRRITVSLSFSTAVFYFFFPAPTIPHFISSSLSPLSLFAEQPSSGQLLIRGRNDRCFAHQQCHLFCLSTNSSCAVHIYFSGGGGTVAWENSHICALTNAYTHTHKHIFTSSVNSLHHSDAEFRLKYNSSLRFASASVWVSGYYCVSRHLAAPPAHWWLSGTMNTVVIVGVGFLKKTLTRGTGESEDCNTRL